MRTSDFKFNLPEQLIAQHPCKHRTDSRLLHLKRDKNPSSGIEHLKFNEFPDLINSNDCLVFNDTRVIPARLHGAKPTGGKVEILIERIIDSHHALAPHTSQQNAKAGFLYQS